MIDRRIEVIDGPKDNQGAFRRVSDLRVLPFVVLLGEPGIGKSTVLETEAAHEGVPVLKVRELMTGAQANPGATLFLDALDEYRADGQPSDKVHSLAHAMTAVKAARWRLSCRSEDWRKGADIAPIKKTTAGAPIVVVQLLPLDHVEAAAILTTLGEGDPDAFLAKAEALGAAGFVENPLSLKLLHKAVAGGEAWPRTRYDLFASAISRLMFECNEEYKQSDRRAPHVILDAAAEVCLLLLTSGARAIWRSNGEPPAGGDARAYVTVHDLGLDRVLLKDTLDTALFRGEGETFEPMHRTVAEYLAGQALAKAVAGTGGRSALPLSRAIALITGSDGAPPTELRGMYAWFATHLARLGDEGGALRLIEADAVSVLAYGDAAAFDTPARKAILVNLDRNDAYFRASEVGITAIGGLAGEDLADDFAAVLTGPPDGTHRLLTVYEALTNGQSVPSLRPRLRAIALDAARPDWQRRRAAEAYLNGADDVVSTCRDLFNALAGEAISAARETLRAQLAARLPANVLSVANVKSVLADYQQIPEDDMVGRLYGLQRRLEVEPLPELFDEPTENWLSKNPHRSHNFEIEHVLDYALAGAIKGTLDLSAARLWRWTFNIRGDAWSKLEDKTAKALASWLDEEEGREAALFDAVLADDDPTTGPWNVTYNYIETTRRNPSAAIIRHILAKAAASSTKVEKDRFLAIVIDVACNPATEIEAYWETYDCIAREPNSEPLLKQLAITTIDDRWFKNQAYAISEHRREAEAKAGNVRALALALAEMRVGGQPHHLACAARWYFEDEQRRGGRPSGIQRVSDLTDDTTTDAILAGWNHLATMGLGGIDAAQLGKAEAEGRRYVVEEAAIAGIDRLISEDRLPEPATMPIEVAVAVLKSSWVVSDQERRSRLERWALDRLNLVPTAGAAQLMDFWGPALDAGATQLSGLWRLLEEDARGGAVEQALDSLLGTRRAMAPEVLQSAVRVGAKHLDPARLLALAEAALDDTAVTGAQRTIWTFVAFALDPVRHAVRFRAEHGDGNAFELLCDNLSNGLMDSFGNIVGVARLYRDATIVRFLGRTVTPEDDLRRGGLVTLSQRLHDAVNQAINALAADSSPESGEALSALVSDPDLTAWRSRLRHALAQQARLRRDQSFEHPTVSAVRAAIAGGPPVNACDLRVVVMEELRRLRAELRTTDTTPWKRYWNVGSNGRADQPLIENECRDHLLDRLRDRLNRYSIAAVVPEARRSDETRADMLVLTGAGRNLPIEAKRHYHADIWVAASTQLQGYTADPGADGFGIYLVFWFGNDTSPTPARPDSGAGPTSAVELETMLIGDLSPELKARTAVIVFDVSDPKAAGLTRARQKRGAKAQPNTSARSGSSEG